MADAQRINISLSEKDDCKNVLKLRNIYQEKQSRPITVAETVRIAVKEAIINNK